MQRLCTNGDDKSTSHFPLTRANLRSQLPAVMRAFFSCGLQDLAVYRNIVTQLYEPDAVFDYPAARLCGRANIRRFWTQFLLGRALQRLDIYRLDINLTFDPTTLKAHMDLECWQRTGYLAWLEAMLGGRKLNYWKVWSSHIIQFREDAAGQLRIQHQEEVADQQIVLGGCLVFGLYAHRLDRGMPLWYVIETLRMAVAWLLCTYTMAIEWVLACLGVRLQ